MRNKMEPRSNKLKNPKEKVSAFYKYDRERDSGYLTDNSPASINNQLQFNFDEESVNEENTDVKSHFEIFDTDEMSDDCFEDEDEMADNINKEVECTMSLERNISVPIPVVRRPSAPAPPINNEIDDGNISKVELFTSYRFQRESCRRNKWFFKPIGRRTISTQTPHRHSQIIQDCVSTLSDRFHPYDASVGRGTVHNRFRYNSHDNVPHSPLPDVVPGRDRSISLPDVPALREAHETEVGRELRRISDEFHFSYHSPRQARILIQPQPGSFPGTWRFGELWDSIRQLFTPSPINRASPD